MKVIFVQTLPIMLDSYLVLSACLKERCIESEVFIETFEKNLVSKILKSEAGLIGFNCLTGSYNWVYNIAKEVKKIKNIPVIIGGCHPTYYPETVDLDVIDYICIGEGEYALVELAEAIRDGKDSGNIRNIAIRKNGKIKFNPLRPIIGNLNTLRFSNREIYHKYDYFLNLEVYNYRTSRYCPYNCAFCFNANINKLYRGEKVFREYSVSYIIEEMLNIKRDYKRLKAFFFNIEIFGINKKWAYELLSLYKEKINLPYTITTRADLVDDDFVKLLKNTNCELVSLSFETANEELRIKVLNKKISNQTFIAAGRKLNSAGIKTRVNCMFCLPDETLNDAFDNIKLIKQMKATDPVGFLLQPFPKTDVYTYAVRKGYIKGKVSIDDLDPLVYFRTLINIPDKKKIIIVQRLFVYACKIPYFDKLLRILVNVPNNIVFDIMHKMGIAVSHKQFYGLSYKGLIKYLFSARKLDVKRSI